MSDRERIAREGFTRELTAVLKQLQAVKTTAADSRGESFGLVIARLGEAQERLAALVDKARDVITELERP